MVIPPGMGKRGAAIIVLCLALLPLAPGGSAVAATSGTTTRVSVSGSGAQGNGNSGFREVVSADGRYVAFESSATNLVPGDTNGRDDIFVYDRSTSGITRASVADDGTQANNSSSLPAISGDGRYVAFASTANNLVPGDTNATIDVFVRDLVAGRTVRASLTSTGGQANRQIIFNGISISRDGRYVAFESTANNLVPDKTGSASDIYVRDLVAATTQRVSVSSGGIQGNSDSYNPALSGDGRYVVFESWASNLVPNDLNSNSDVFIHDLASGTTALVSVSTAGSSGDRESGEASASADGRYVAFFSAASNLVSNDVNGQYDAFVRDMLTGTTVLASQSDTGAIGNSNSNQPAISGDGRFVAFWSAATNLVPGDTNAKGDIFVRDLVAGTTSRVSVSSDGGQANGASFDPWINGDGSVVVFDSQATNLVTGDTNARSDVFARELKAPNTAPVVLVGGNEVRFDPLFTRPGSFVDPDPGQHWTGTVDYGDGGGPQPLPLSDKSFVLVHQYPAPGAYTISASVSDGAGGLGSATFSLDLRRRPLIFVPGFAGSALAATRDAVVPFKDSQGRDRLETVNAGDVVWPDHLLAHPFDGEYMGILQFAGGSPVAGDAIAPNGDIMALPGGYPDIFPFFTGAGYRQNSDLFVHTYDWRFGPTHSLADFDALVDRALAATGADRVDIVAHSYGTTVTRAFLQAGRNRGNVAHVVLAGAPNLGTPEGALAVLAGECFPDLGIVSSLGICPLSPRTTQFLLREWPGAAIQVPGRAYYGLFDGADIDHPVAFEQEVGPFTVGANDYPFLAQTELERGVPTDTIDEVETFRAGDLTWTRNLFTDTTLLAGTGECTIGQVIRRPVLELLPTPHIGTAWDARDVDGDGTVVRQSASLQDASRGFDLAPGTVLYRATKHDGLMRSAALTDVLGVLRGSPVDRGAPRPFFGCRILSIHSPMEVVLQDNLGRRTGSVDGETMIGESPNVRYTRVDDMKMLTVDDAGSYKVSLYGTGAGETTVRIRWIAGGGIAHETIYRHVPTTPATRATLSFDQDQGSASALSVDVDGDGTVDLIVQAEQLSTGVSSDTTPPDVAITAPAVATAVGRFMFGWASSDSGSGISRSVGSLDGTVVAGPGVIEPSPGVHELAAFAEDRAGNAAFASATVTVLASSWARPLSEATFVGNAGRAIPVKFSITDAAGTAVLDRSVAVSLRDAAGRDVTPVLRMSAKPSSGVVFEDGSYHANLSTAGLAPGQYILSVRFASDLLVGELQKSVSLR